MQTDMLLYYVADGLARYDRDNHGFERPPKFYLNTAEDMLTSYYTYRATQDRLRRNHF